MKSKNLFLLMAFCFAAMLQAQEPAGLYRLQRVVFDNGASTVPDYEQYKYCADAAALTVLKTGERNGTTYFYFRNTDGSPLLTSDRVGELPRVFDVSEQGFSLRWPSTHDGSMVSDVYSTAAGMDPAIVEAFDLLRGRGTASGDLSGTWLVRGQTWNALNDYWWDDHTTKSYMIFGADKVLTLENVQDTLSKAFATASLSTLKRLSDNVVSFDGYDYLLKKISENTFSITTITPSGQTHTMLIDRTGLPASLQRIFGTSEPVRDYSDGLALKQELLRKGGYYASEASALRLRFDVDARRARSIREAFRLDTLVKGSMSTWEKTLAVARFVARNIPHANQTAGLAQVNALTLWDYHLTTEPAFNCRWHSIMLQDLLLSLGLKARFITCLPALPDQDCHVVNAVWLPELGRWAMIDTDMHHYFTDGDGEPVGLQEIRAAYVGGPAVEMHALLPSDSHDADDYYREYLAKNVYCFAGYEHSDFDVESAQYEGERRYFYLLPRDANATRFTSNVERVVRSEADFWQAPKD